MILMDFLHIRSRKRSTRKKKKKTQTTKHHKKKKNIQAVEIHGTSSKVRVTSSVKFN